MSIFKCKMCGGTIEFNQGDTVGVCDSCGTKQTLPRLDDDKKANLYDRANHFRRNNDFDKAMSIYEQILNEDNTDAEAYWSLVLCRYGIEYVEDPTSNKRVPTVNRAQFTSIFDDEDYKSALQYADDYQKAIYEEEASTINEIQKGILAISQKEEPFDVFICYKETDNSGRRTPDSVLANDLYHQLTSEGFKVFFAAITLEDKLGTAYEPYIFAALNSSKVMVVLGTKPEYFNAVWVKNEWSRYLALIKNGAKKMLIPAYKDMDPYDLPEEFSHLQAQDMSKLGFMQDLIRGIKKIINSGEKETNKESIVSNGTNVEATIDRALLLIEDGENEKADEALEEALKIAPKHPMIYIGKLLIETGVKKVSDLGNLTNSFENSSSYEKALRFADSKLKAELEGYVETINAINKKNTYQEAINAMDEARCESDYNKVVKLFESLGDYEDCKEKINECVYQGAIWLMNRDYYDKLADYNKSIEKFASIKEYKDSEDKIDECERKILAEKELLAKKKKRNKKIAAITIPSICVVIAAIIVYTTVFVPKQKYEKANALFADAKYSEAYDLYSKLGKYNDSVDKAKECLYIQATNFRNEKNWDKANELFEQIKDYKDSKDLIHYHQWTETASKAATCTEAGYKDSVCSCGETKHEDVVALGHNYSSATCTKPVKCTRCGATSGSALGHTTGGTKCERCGANTFETLKYSGTGKGFIRNINLPTGQYIVKGNYNGNSNFIINAYNGDGKQVGLFANDIGPCNSQETFNGSITNGYLEIEYAEGSWTITIEAQ